jgi:predicted nucleic acid-binding protein
MNHAVVVDASLAVKWVVDEPDSDRALKLHDDAVRDQRPLLSAPHFPGEVANAIYQRVRSTDPSKHLDLTDAEEALDQFLAFPVELSNPPGLVREAFAFAQDRGLVSIYDALYVVLARMVAAELWTADQRLLTQLSGRAAWVRPLREYPL